MELEQEIVAEDSETVASEADSTSAEERDYEAEARQHGWTPKDEFRGDQAKWVDAETFVKRADEVMPFLKKQNAGLKREMDDLKKTMKRASEHWSKVEERAYNRAMTDLQAKLDEAVESGDVNASRRVLKEMDELKADVESKPDEAVSEQQVRQEFAEWVEENDWYVLDDKKRTYADLQASAMGKAVDWPEGPKAWLDELGRRVEKKFTERKPSPVNGGGNRGSPSPGGKTFNDLPAQAKALADKWHKQGVFGDPAKVTLADARKRYVETYPWD